MAFSITAGYNSEFRVSISGICPNDTSRNGTHDELVKFGYPFDDADYYIEGGESGCFKSDHHQHKLGSDYKSESQFFVFVGVVSFLYCVVAAVYYVSFEDPEKYGPGGTGTSIKSFAVLVRLRK